MTTPALGPPPENLTSPAKTSRASAVAFYVQFLTSQYGAKAGSSFSRYAATHPLSTANAALNQWANLMAADLGPGLANAVSQAISEQAQETGQLGVGGAKGFANASKDILGGFNIGGWFLRIGEILVGLVLVGIGLNSMLKGKPLNVVTSAAGLAAKVVPV